MNIGLILTIFLTLVVGYLFYQIRQLQGEVLDLKVLTSNGVTIDELEQTVVPAVESLRTDTEDIRRNLAILSAALRSDHRSDDQAANVQYPTPDEECSEDGDMELDDDQTRSTENLHTLLSNVAAVFGNFKPPKDLSSGSAPPHVGIMTTRVMMAPQTLFTTEPSIVEADDEEGVDIEACEELDAQEHQLDRRQNIKRLSK